MKALSIWAPWIDMVVKGKKTIETRSWRTDYRGRLLLVGSKKPEGEYAGLAACTANLIDCRRMSREDEAAARCSYVPGLYAWVLQDIKPIEAPFLVRGKLGLYEIALHNLCYKACINYGDELNRLTGGRAR